MGLKLSSNTRTILSNFAKINQNIQVRKGNVLKTVAKSGTILAEAIIEETIPKSFGIYDLNQFLSALDLFEDPELEFHAGFVSISEKHSRANYAYAGEKMNLTPYPEGDIDHSDAVVEFQLQKADLDRLKVAVTTLATSEILIRADDGKVELTVENVAKSSFTISVDGAKPTIENFQVVLNSKNLLLIPDTYTIAVFSEGLNRFKSSRVTYWIGAEATGTRFGDDGLEDECESEDEED